jgi:hypothetical protein
MVLLGKELRSAAKRGDLEALQAALRQHPELIDSANEEG